MRSRPATARQLRAIVAELHEADLGDLIGALEPDDRVRLVELTGRDFDFSALNEVDEAVREEILEELPPETVAEGVRELESDDAVELLEDPRRRRTRRRSSRSCRCRSASRSSAACTIRRTPPAAACRPSSSPCRQDFTVGQAIDYMRETPDLPDRFYEIYVVDKDQHWQGAVPLDVLLRARRPVPLTELTDEDRRRVSVLEDQEEVARMFGKYNLVAAPVLDTQDRLVGVITVDDVVDVIEEEADEDLKALGGVTSDEELSDTVLDHRARPLQLAAGQSRHRLPRVLRARPVRGPAREDGGARRAGADRGEPGRQCRDPDHDGRGARARHPRARLLQCLARGDAREAWSASSTVSPLRVITGIAAVAWFKIPASASSSGSPSSATSSPARSAAS